MIVCAISAHAIARLIVIKQRYAFVFLITILPQKFENVGSVEVCEKELKCKFLIQAFRTCKQSNLVELGLLKKLRNVPCSNVRWSFLKSTRVPEVRLFISLIICFTLCPVFQYLLMMGRPKTSANGPMVAI